MGRCGCDTGACQCVINAGSGVTVTGTGAADTPYVVSASGSTAWIRVDDSTYPQTHNSGSGGVAVFNGNFDNVVASGGQSGIWDLDTTNQAVRLLVPATLVFVTFFIVVSMPTPVAGNIFAETLPFGSGQDISAPQLSMADNGSGNFFYVGQLAVYGPEIADEWNALLDMTALPPSVDVTCSSFGVKMQALI